MKRITSTITDDELRAIVRENAVGIKELRTDTAAFKAEMRETVARMEADTDRLKANMDAGFARMDAGFARMDAGLADLRQYVYDTFGYIDNSLGRVSEMVIIPGILPAVGKLGLSFDEMLTNKKFKRPNGGSKFAEADVFLKNGTAAMAVEIKTHLAASMIDGWVGKLKLMRKYENVVGIKGKVLYGAVAGIVIDKHVQKHAFNNGLYVIEIIEDKNRLKPMAPPAGKVGTW